MYGVFAENFYHVFLACLNLFGVQGAFSDYNLNFAVHYKFNQFIREFIIVIRIESILLN